MTMVGSPAPRSSVQALQLLLTEVRQGRVDMIIVYKVDRLTRSLVDFAKLVETFGHHEVSFVSVTQSFNTSAKRRWRALSCRSRPPKLRVASTGVLQGIQNVERGKQ
jgi:hypothetical protein